MNEGSDSILFFDSDCILCQRSVRFFFEADKKARLRFAGLDSQTAKSLAIPIERVGGVPQSLVFYRKGKIFQKSTAVFEALRVLGFPWSLAVAFKSIPRVIRDTVYDWVSRHRFDWFGRSNECLWLSNADRARFLP